jgi:cyclopropane-fatty-acyl-phospholipid synthase
MLRRLVDVHGARRAVGLTLSVAQAEHVNAFGDERCTATVENWADHVPPDGGYDAIVSIGAFEHFADFGMTRERRVAAYRAFFDRCREWLPPGGRIGLQTMLNGSNTNLDRETTRELLFIVDRIFPESQIPWLSEVIEAAERRFDVVTVRNDPDHYARTCATWHAALVARRGDAVALVGEEVVADYERYLSASSRHLARRHLGLGRLILERV